MARRILTVTQLNDYVTGVLSRDPMLRSLNISGEISNFRVTSSGHAYFALKDEGALVRCVMFRSQLSGLRFRPEEGMHVVANGAVSLYGRDGQYQLYVQAMEPVGVGEWYQRFEQIKQALLEEGYFDPAHKKPLPFLPRRVGVVTSPTGAVIRDICQVTRRRFPNMDVLLCPAKVQGEGAAQEIARGIALLDDVPDVDVIIVGRGGGSIEDLWAFNEPVVAAAIFACRTPVISAVGHETDVTIADFVADLRAPTPSAAAEVAVPKKEECLKRLETLLARAQRGVLSEIGAQKHALALLQNRAVLAGPERKLTQERQRLDILQERMEQAARRTQERAKSALETLGARLEGASPLAALRRGYVLAQEESGAVASRAKQLQSGRRIKLRFCDGTALARVETVELSDELLGGTDGTKL